MGDSSSEGSADEDELLKNFDEEAKLIIQKDTLPVKSADRYMLVYNTYKQWKEDNKNLLSNAEENNLIVYFKSLQTRLKPPTLWSIWSMLRKTLGSNDNIDISNFLSLRSFIKNNAKGYKPKKAYVFRWNQVVKFINEALNDMYLALKVILIFGICGCLRCDEITNLKVQNVEDLGDKFLVSIENNKNDYAGQFVIGSLFYEKVKTYISLRPADIESNRFFIKYKEGQCYRQHIGVHKIGEIPSKIATYLQLPNPDRYTGHCFRRTSATLLSESGATIQMIKQLGRWRSDLIAQGYIENSLHNRELIYNGVIQNTKTLDRLPDSSTCAQVPEINLNVRPSTSAQTSITPQIINNHHERESNFQLDWSDFAEDFDYHNNPIPSEVVKSGFVTAKNNQILVPIINENKQNDTNNKFFLNKPAIKLNFKNKLSNQTPTVKKRRFNEDFDNENYNGINPTLKKHESKFENCTFNNCTFNFTE